MRRALVSTGLALALAAPLLAAAPPPPPRRMAAGEQLSDGNRPERLEWFRNLGFGMFVHWSLDSQIGSVISHSTVGADAAYLKRFFEDLPKTFDPHKYHPRDWAVLAKLAGMRYVVFTAKHHSGFCMYDSKTTKFGILQTPYGKDVLAELVKALRAEGIAVGLYFSPDDFHWLYTHGKLIDRNPRPGVNPQEDPEFMAFTKAQLREMLTQYGPIDVLFIDGRADGLRELAWEIRPDTVVTRGAIATPEQKLLAVPLDKPWESCVTMGTAWQYKPTQESYKSITQLVEMLIETRAKGGNLLLNVGPKPDGELPIEQEERLRGLALWHFIFGESVDGVRPWVVANEGDLWFTKKKDEDTVYVFVTKQPNWSMDETKTFTLRSVKATDATKVSIPGQTGEVIEYRPDRDPRPSWKQDEKGLHVTVTLAQRYYDNRRWAEPVAIKLTNVKPALVPPKVEIVGAARDAAPGTATLRARLDDLGMAPSVETGFQYRRKKRGEELYEADEPWKDTPLAARTATGAFEASVTGLLETESYEYRAVVKHPLLTVMTEEKVIAPR